MTLVFSIKMAQFYSGTKEDVVILLVENVNIVMKEVALMLIRSEQNVCPFLVIRLQDKILMQRWLIDPFKV